jgi:GTP-dependent phosphoenolpyruvate carboxykinase
MRFYGYRLGGTPPPRTHEIVSVGDAHGRIAVYLDKQAAIDLAFLYGSDDGAAKELMAAVEQASPSGKERP